MCDAISDPATSASSGAEIIPASWFELYKEICTNIRTTDDTSFKLLGLVPTLLWIGRGCANTT